MNISNFNNDKIFSSKCIPLFDKYYHSQQFQEVLKKLYNKKREIKVLDIWRGQDMKTQLGYHLDAVINLSTGTSLKIDEKIRDLKNKWDPDLFPVEFISIAEDQKDGWAYHYGTTIIHGNVQSREGVLNGEITTLFGEPVVYNISGKFVNDIIRSEKYEKRFNKTWGMYGGYTSGFNLVPRNVLEEYFP